jgi:hypothetical protein
MLMQLNTSHAGSLTQGMGNTSCDQGPSNPKLTQSPCDADIIMLRSLKLCACFLPAPTAPFCLFVHCCCFLHHLQDVELQSNCCLTCFGLQAVNVQTAGQGGTIMPEVSATFLKSPEKVREAIRLAVKLNKQQGQGSGGYGAPRAPMSAWGAVAPAPKGSGSLMQRLQAMDGLVACGVLTRAEADGLKVRLQMFCVVHACLCLHKVAVEAIQKKQRGHQQQNRAERSTREQQPYLPSAPAQQTLYYANSEKRHLPDAGRRSCT